MAFDWLMGGLPSISSTGSIPNGVVGFDAAQASNASLLSSKSTPARTSASRHSSPRLRGLSK
jgi:hypothetical protein